MCKAIAAESSAVLRKVGQLCSRLCLGEHRLGILLITRQDILGIVKILVCVLDKSSIVDSAALARQSVAQLLLKLLKLERAAEEISRQIRLTQLCVKLLSTAALLLGSRDGIVDRLLLVVRQTDLLFLSQLIYRCAVTQRRADRILKLLRTLRLGQIGLGKLVVYIHVDIAVVIVADLKRAELHHRIAFAARSKEQRRRQHGKRG